ncbi:MAG: LPS-assembly lipoprotein LptE [Candidatus Nitrosoglobus sp.]|jgi:LPS-assembly lipoprotein
MKVFLFSLLLLMGCGFHLRGNVQLSPLLTRTYVQGIPPYSELGVQIKRSLEANGVTVTSEPKNASATLSITYNQIQRQVLSVGGSTAKVQEYALKYVLQFQVTNPKGKILLPSQRIELMREYRFDALSVLSAGDQENLLREAMQKDIVQQILWRLEALPSTLSG